MRRLFTDTNDMTVLLRNLLILNTRPHPPFSFYSSFHVQYSIVGHLQPISIAVIGMRYDESGKLDVNHYSLSPQTWSIPENYHQTTAPFPFRSTFCGSFVTGGTPVAARFVQQYNSRFYLLKMFPLRVEMQSSGHQTRNHISISHRQYNHGERNIFGPSRTQASTCNACASCLPILRLSGL